MGWYFVRTNLGEVATHGQLAAACVQCIHCDEHHPLFANPARLSDFGSIPNRGLRAGFFWKQSLHGVLSRQTRVFGPSWA